MNWRLCWPKYKSPLNSWFLRASSYLFYILSSSILKRNRLNASLDIIFFRLGQSLCTYSINPSLSARDQRTFTSSSNLLQETKVVGYEMANIGVSNLPPVVRTDLANRLILLTFAV